MRLYCSPGLGSSGLIATQGPPKGSQVPDDPQRSGGPPESLRWPGGQIGGAEVSGIAGGTLLGMAGKGLAGVWQLRGGRWRATVLRHPDTVGHLPQALDDITWHSPVLL